MIKGQSCKSSSLTIRIVAGTWCVGCFFLVQIYSSTLTSHLMESNQKPIVNSVQELVNHPDVQLTADRGMAADILLVVRGVSYIHPACFKQYFEIYLCMDRIMVGNRIPIMGNSNGSEMF